MSMKCLFYISFVVLSLGFLFLSIGIGIASAQDVLRLGEENSYVLDLETGRKLSYVDFLNSKQFEEGDKLEFHIYVSKTGNPILDDYVLELRTNMENPVWKFGDDIYHSAEVIVWKGKEEHERMIPKVILSGDVPKLTGEGIVYLTLTVGTTKDGKSLETIIQKLEPSMKFFSFSAETLIYSASTKIDILKRSNVNTSLIEEALKSAQNAYDLGKYDEAFELAQSAQKMADDAYEAQQHIESAQSEIEGAKSIGAEVKNAENKLKEAKDALNNGYYQYARDWADDTSELAIHASIGSVQIKDLKALATKYDERTVVISGTIRDIETVYGKGYAFALDDGSGMISVSYQGSLGDIKEDDKVTASGVFQASTGTVVAGIVQKSGVDGVPEFEAILAPGYKWYHDDEFSYMIAYPENWEKFPLTLLEGQEVGIRFKSDKKRPSGGSEATIGVTVFSDPKQARWWESEEFKERGMDMECRKVIINDKEGDEAIYSPFPGIKARWIVFTAGDLYYVVDVYTSVDLYDKYADTFDTAINSFVNPAPIAPTPTPEEGVPGFEVVFAIVGLLAVAYLLRRKK